MMTSSCDILVTLVLLLKSIKKNLIRFKKIHYKSKYKLKSKIQKIYVIFMLYKKIIRKKYFEKEYLIWDSKFEMIEKSIGFQIRFDDHFDLLISN